MTDKGLRRAVLALFAIPALGFLATAGSSQTRPALPVPVLSAPIRAGDSPGTQVYARTCAYCHDHGVGPVIKGRELDPAAIRLMVRHGAFGMPAFRPTEITDPELEAVAKMLSESK